MSVKISMELAPQRGDLSVMRDRWIEADQLGADVLWVCDHFFAQNVDAENLGQGQVAKTDDAENYEAICVQAAMAATTTRAKIGCLVHAIHYRNPNLLADMARTIDHLSGGRFILGLGAGYIERDYVEYGYEFGTQKSRLLDLGRELPVIRDRLAKLTPPPTGDLPILVASMGEKIGLPIVAKNADMWHVIGPIDQIKHKMEVFRKHCEAIGRDPNKVEIVALCFPQMFPDHDPDVFYDELGIRHIHSMAFGPDWDLGPLRELLAWRDQRFSNKN